MPKFFRLGETPFKCDECDQSFRRFTNLTRHKKTVHRGVRSHACKQCDKCYSSKQGLKKHMVVHMDVRRRDGENLISQSQLSA